MTTPNMWRIPAKDVIPYSCESPDGGLRDFYDTMLGVPYVDPVYTLEAHALPGAFFWSTGSDIRTDNAATLEDLLDMAYTAFSECISHVFVTHAGERHRFDTPVSLFCHFKPE